MFRACLWVLFLVVVPAFQGCGALEFFQGDSEERAKETASSKEQVSKEITRLKSENIDLKKKVDALKKENEGIRENTLNEIAKAEGKSGVLKEELKNLREQNRKIENENRRLKERLEKFKQKGDLRALKIKVLSGDGSLDSAKRMSKRLIGMDYEVRLIGFAPRSNFKKNTVYFAPKFEKEGRALVSHLGADTALKPLTWSSVFDLIVVAVKNP